MKRSRSTRTILLVVAVCVPLTVNAQSDWPLVVAQEHFVFPLPASMELAEGTFKSARDEGREYLIVGTDRFNVRAQPKGMNATGADPGVLRHAAIVVDLDQGEPGSFAFLGADITMPAEQLQQLSDHLHSGLVRRAEEGKELRDISWGGVDIVQLEGTQAIRIRYSGKVIGEDGDVVFNMYTIQNFDCMYTITVSYAQEEQTEWQADLETAFSAMRFAARGVGE